MVCMRRRWQGSVLSTLAWNCLATVDKLLQTVPPARCFWASSTQTSINQSIKDGLSNMQLPKGPHRKKELPVIYKTRPGYESWNRCSFSRFLKVSRDGAEVTSTGRSFHMRAPATRKARRPIVGSLIGGTSRSKSWSWNVNVWMWFICSQQSFSIIKQHGTARQHCCTYNCPLTNYCALFKHCTASVYHNIYQAHLCITLMMEYCVINILVCDKDVWLRSCSVNRSDWNQAWQKRSLLVQTDYDVTSFDEKPNTILHTLTAHHFHHYTWAPWGLLVQILVTQHWLLTDNRITTTTDKHATKHWQICKKKLN